MPPSIHPDPWGGPNGETFRLKVLFRIETPSAPVAIGRLQPERNIVELAVELAEADRFAAQLDDLGLSFTRHPNAVPYLLDT